jgi:hypothetical protein
VVGNDGWRPTAAGGWCAVGDGGGLAGVARTRVPNLGSGCSLLLRLSGKVENMSRWLGRVWVAIEVPQLAGHMAKHGQRRRAHVGDREHESSSEKHSRIPHLDSKPRV